jgi:hypothetical protein
VTVSVLGRLIATPLLSHHHLSVQPQLVQSILPQFVDREKGNVALQLIFLGAIFSVLAFISDGSSKSKYAYDELSRSRPIKPAVPLGNNAKLIHANADAKLVHGNAGNGSRISQLTTNRVFQIN